MPEIEPQIDHTHAAVLEAAQRRRSTRRYILPGVLAVGLATPIVARGAVPDPVPQVDPGAATTATSTTTTATTTTSTVTTTTSTPSDPAANTQATPPPRSVAPETTTDATVTTDQETLTDPDAPAPAAELVTEAVPPSQRKKTTTAGLGNAIEVTPAQRRAAKREQQKISNEQAQSALGAGSGPIGGDLGALMLMPSTQQLPSEVIDSFQIPPFLLPIYQAAGAQYGIRWEVLAAINEVETNYGRNLNVSSAGAQGWMQFMPSTWERYGIDANRDGEADPYNPVDAIFTAGRYLKAAGADTDLRRAIFSYNHADWYVRDVLSRARRIAATPPSLVDALSQMADGQFPVAAKGKVKAVNGGIVVKTEADSAVIAVQDGEIVRSGRSKRLGNFIQIRDAQGTLYTYGNLKSVGMEREGDGWARRLPTTSEPVPAASLASDDHATDKDQDVAPDAATVAAWTETPANTAALLTGATSLAPLTPGADSAPTDQAVSPEAEPAKVKVAKRGRRVIAGTVLGRAGADGVRFEIKPAGASRIDPEPIVAGWQLLQDTALFRVKGRAAGYTGQVLLMSKDALQHRVLHDDRIKIYEGGRQDIEAGVIDRRVLATLEFLAESGLNPTVSCLRTGHSYYTTSGNVSAHSSGNAVDISAINGIPIEGNQGAGSITDTTVRKLLALQGSNKPNQIITLMQYPGTDNTLAMADHYNHIHVGFQPTGTIPSPDGTTVSAEAAVLKPSQWDALVSRLGTIENPAVSGKPSKAALRVARAQLREGAKARAELIQEKAVSAYDAFQDGVKDPFIPPWMAKNKD